jgi:hypothetical protein
VRALIVEPSATVGFGFADVAGVVAEPAAAGRSVSDGLPRPQFGGSGLRRAHSVGPGGGLAPLTTLLPHGTRQTSARPGGWPRSPGMDGEGIRGMAELGSTPANARPMTKPAVSSSWRARFSGPSTAGTPPTARTSSAVHRSLTGVSGRPAPTMPIGQ